MQKIIEWNNLNDVAYIIDDGAMNYIRNSGVQSFEGFGAYNVLAFDLYDVRSESHDSNRVIVYMDETDMVFICADTDSCALVKEIVSKIPKGDELDNEKLLYRFFTELMKDDTEQLDRFEDAISATEIEVLEGKYKNILSQITEWRGECLRLKHYYEQFDTIFDEIQTSDSTLLSDAGQNAFRILGLRANRYLDTVENLQEMVTQLRETYHSQLSIEQNDLMKVFTIVTAIFLPLTLLTGWFGMNFRYMPEFSWEYAYPTFIGVCVAIVVGMIWYFKHRKWL